MAEEIKQSPWQGIDTELIVEVPDSVRRLMTDRNIARQQTTVKVNQIGSRRFQIDQRREDGASLRKIVLDLFSDDRTKARVSGYQVLLFQEGEEWKPEPVQDALNVIAQEIIIP